MYKCFPYFHINLFTFMPQSWVLILLIKKKKKSWMLILILLLHTGTKNNVDYIDDSVIDIKCSDLMFKGLLNFHKIMNLLSA